MELEPKSGDAPQTDAEADVYEMLWDCEYCGTPKLLGLTHRFCPNCGAGQNPQKRYFPPDDEKIAVRNHPYHGADRLCPSCRNPNSAKAQFCGQCGTPLDGAAVVKTQADQVKVAGAKVFAAVAPAEAKQPDGKRLWWGAIAALVVLVALIGAALLWTSTIPVTLDRHSWERTINIESFLPRQQQAWCDAIPGDAYAISRSERMRSQRKILDGEICDTRRIDRGDGTYQEKQECRPKYRTEPVYDQYCQFTVKRWEHARSVVTSGQDRTPSWGNVALHGAGKECFGCERESSREETFYLHFKASQGKPEEYRCAVNATLWQQAEPQSAWTMEKGKLFGNAHCGSLKPAK